MNKPATAAVMLAVGVLLGACRSGEGDAAISTNPVDPAETTIPTPRRTSEVPAGEPKPACELLSADEVGGILGNRVRPGSGSGRNCLWGTAVDRGTSAQLSVAAPGRARAAQECTTQRNSLAKEIRQEPVGDLGTSAVWATQQLTLLLQGSLVACFEDAVVMVIVTGEREAGSLRNAAANLARQAYARL